MAISQGPGASKTGLGLRNTTMGFPFTIAGRAQYFPRRKDCLICESLIERSCWRWWPQ